MATRVGALTLLGKHHEALTAVFLWYVQMLWLYPPKQSNSLRQDAISFEVIRRDWSWWYHARYLWRKRATKSTVRDADEGEGCLQIV